jgi:hypothetical protein
MTSLYTAIKIHEPEAMEPKVVASLSRGAYTEDEVIAMEQQILHAIKWRMNPPTALSFVQHFMCLLPEGAMSDTEKARTVEFAKFQTELAVNSYEFVGYTASDVAFAAVTNALQCGEIDTAVEYQLVGAISQAVNTNNESGKLICLQNMLFNALQKASTNSTSSVLRPSATVTKTMDNDMGSSSSSIHISPRSVSATN